MPGHTPQERLRRLAGDAEEPAEAPEIKIAGAGFRNLPLETGEFVRSGEQGPSEAEEEFFGGVGSVVSDFLDVIDRPFRAGRHAARGLLGIGGKIGRALGGEGPVIEKPGEEFEQALTAFLPASWARKLGTKPSGVAPGAETLEELGMGTGPKIPVIAPEGGARSVLGFMADLLTPAPGAAVALKAIGGAAKGVGRAGVAVAEKTAETTIPGVGTAARGVLGGLEHLSEPFRLRHYPEIVDKIKLMRGEQAAMRAVALDESRALAAKAAQIGAEQEKIAESAMEMLGMREAVMKRLGIQASDVPGIPRDIPGQVAARELATGEPAKAARSLSAEADAGRVLDSLLPRTREFLEQSYAGSPAVFERYGRNMGKLARESEFGMSQIIDQERFVAFAEKHGGHLRHEWATPLDAARDQLGKIVDEMPVLRGMKDPQKIIAQAARGSVKAREYVGTLQELSRQFPGYLEEAAATLSAHEGAQLATAVPAAKFARGLAASYGKPARMETIATGRVVPLPDKGYSVVETATLPKYLQKAFTQKVGKEAVPIQLPNAVYSTLLPVIRTLGKDPQLNGFRQSVEAFTNAFQAITIGLFPQTWLRNMESSVFQNWASLGIGHARNYPVAMRILGGPKLIRNVKVEGGRTISYGRFMREAIEDSAFNGGFAGTELGEYFGRAAAKPTWKSLKGLLHPDPTMNVLTRGGYWAMNTGDNVTRLAHYLTVRQRTAGAFGSGRAAARKSMDDYLYRAGQITSGEKLLLRPFFPFYSWSRYNLVNAPRQMLMSARRYTAFARSAGLITDEDGRVTGIPRSILPNWIQSQVGIPVGVGEDGSAKVFLLGNYIPFAQLYQVDSGKKFVNFVMQQLTPPMREVIQRSIGDHGWDFFFQRAIEKQTGEQENFLGMLLGRRLVHALRGLRLLNEIDRTFFPQTAESIRDDLVKDLSADEKVARWLGGKLYSVDLWEAKKRYVGGLEREVSELKSLRKRAVKAGTALDLANADVADDNMDRLKAKLKAAQGWNPYDMPEFQR